MPTCLVFVFGEDEAWEVLGTYDDVKDEFQRARITCEYAEFVVNPGDETEYGRIYVDPDSVTSIAEMVPERPPDRPKPALPRPPASVRRT